MRDIVNDLSQITADDAEKSWLAALERYVRYRVAHTGCPGEMHKSPGDIGQIAEFMEGVLELKLRRSADRHPWIYLRIAIPSIADGPVTVSRLAPWLKDLQATGELRGWWWLNKSDVLGAGIRLRLQVSAASRCALTDGVTTYLNGLGLHSTELIYEPEFRLFGGDVGIALAHRHFCEDSAFVAEWMSHARPRRTTALPGSVSLALILNLLSASGIDPFEAWDVFAGICIKRRLRSADVGGVPHIRQHVRSLVRARPDHLFDLYLYEEASLLNGYEPIIHSFGRDLQSACYGGKLACGLREFLVPLILFDWNRIGLSWAQQSVLAHALVE